MENKELISRVKEDDVKFISLQFSDVTGSVKSVDITTERLVTALEDGVWFDGSSVEGFARVQESDMRLVLDPETYAVLPWSPDEYRRARVFCDIYKPDGEPFEGDPRGVLKKVLKIIDEKGWVFNIGPSSCSRGMVLRISIPSPMMLEVILTFQLVMKQPWLEMN